MIGGETRANYKKNFCPNQSKNVDSTRVVDVHTHLYPASFGGLLLRGIDELLTYHYLIAETLCCQSIGAKAYML